MDESLYYKPFLDRLKKFIIEANRQGLNVDMQCGYRSFAEQDKLFNQVPKVTNARGGFSWHNYGTAADVVFKDKNGKWTWSNPDKDWKKLGEIGKSCGLEWGGDWAKFPDRPHFQYTKGLSIRTALRLHQQGGIGLVWLEIDKIHG